MDEVQIQRWLNFTRHVKAIKNNSENWNVPIGKNLSIPKILKLIQSKKLQILTTA